MVTPAKDLLSTEGAQQQLLVLCSHGRIQMFCPMTPLPRTQSVTDHTHRCLQVFRPMIGFSFLYVTVLSMGFLMTSYVQWAGIPLDEISIFRGFGAGALAALCLKKKVIR